MPIEFVPKQIRSGINIFCAFQQTLNMFVKIDLWKWADYPILKPEKPPDKNGQLSFNPDSALDFVIKENMTK
jgi:hypothetical protein